VVITSIVYLNRNHNPIAAAKLPYLTLATAANLTTTAYALLIMVPLNRKQAAIADSLWDRGHAVGGDEKGEEVLFRRLQTRWARLNYGRALVMFVGCLAGMVALLVQ
jgi:Domain of unknown function (DUF1772)